MEIKLSLDASEAESSLQSLIHFANRFPEIVNGLLGTREALSKLFRVELDGLPATGTDDFRVVLRCTDFHRHLVAALRALERETLVVEKPSHV
jgi:hypothetical protein